MANKNKNKNNNHKKSANKVAEQQLQKMQATQSQTIKKASSALVSTAIACLFAFIGLLIMKLCGMAISGWIVAAPFFILLIVFVFILFTVGRTMMKQGLLDPSAIRAEEQRMMNKKMSNNQKFTNAQKTNNKNQKYNKYKNIK